MSDFEVMPVGTAARISDLEAEVERIRVELGEERRDLEKTEAMCAEHCAEMKRLRKDAVRYRKLRNNKTLRIDYYGEELDRWLDEQDLWDKRAEHSILAESATEIEQEVDRLRKATQLCDKHAPNGGTVSACVICSGQKLSYALSRISYLCEPPNEMEFSSYDLHYNEDAVVAQVERLRAQQSEPVREWRGLTDEEIDALLRAIKEGQR